MVYTINEKNMHPHITVDIFKDDSMDQLCISHLYRARYNSLVILCISDINLKPMFQYRHICVILCNEFSSMGFISQLCNILGFLVPVASIFVLLASRYVVTLGGFCKIM